MFSAAGGYAASQLPGCAPHTDGWKLAPAALDGMLDHVEWVVLHFSPTDLENAAQTFQQTSHFGPCRFGAGRRFHVPPSFDATPELVAVQATTLSASVPPALHSEPAISSAPVAVSSAPVPPPVHSEPLVAIGQATASPAPESTAVTAIQGIIGAIGVTGDWDVFYLYFATAASANGTMIGKDTKNFTPAQFARMFPDRDLARVISRGFLYCIR